MMTVPLVSWSVGDLLVEEPLLLEDAVHFSRSLRSLELLPVQHLLLQLFNGLKNKGWEIKKPYGKD